MRRIIYGAVAKPLCNGFARSSYSFSAAQRAPLLEKMIIFAEISARMPSELYNEVSKFSWSSYTIRLIFVNFYYIISDITEDDIIECLAELNRRGVDLSEVIEYTSKASKELTKVALWCFNEAGLKLQDFHINYSHAIQNCADIRVIEAMVNSHSRAFGRPLEDMWRLHIFHSILHEWMPPEMIIPIAQLCVKNGKGKVELSNYDIDTIIKIVNRPAVSPELQTAIVILIRGHLREKLLPRAAKTIMRHLLQRIFAPDHIWSDQKSTIEKYCPAELR